MGVKISKGDGHERLQRMASVSRQLQGRRMRVGVLDEEESE